MDIRQLETFITVADNKSFTKASEILYVTQPTVSNHIAGLEKELDTVLFIRTRRNVSLTSSGQIFYRHAAKLLNDYKNMLVELKSFNITIKGHLNIYASSVPRKFFLPNLLKNFSKDYPLIGYSLINDDSEAVINSLMEAETDFGFVGMKVESPKLSYHEVMKDELVFITSKETSVHSDNGYISIDEVLQNKIMLREEGSGTRRLFENGLKKIGKKIDRSNIFAIIEDPSTIMKMVSNNLAAAIISEHETKELMELDLIHTYKIKDLELKRSFYFVYNTDMQYVPVNKMFRSYVLNSLNL
ncbi:MAG: selenium metabolism-associated LysR family transcriptional regulator [Tissierellia bacterium]|nr:selenium metabolism-associated LysR family transcriptional regulator [Tissierellia bacterium]